MRHAEAAVCEDVDEYVHCYRVGEDMRSARERGVAGEWALSEHREHLRLNQLQYLREEIHFSIYSLASGYKFQNRIKWFIGYFEPVKILLDDDEDVSFDSSTASTLATPRTTSESRLGIRILLDNVNN